MFFVYTVCSPIEGSSSVGSPLCENEYSILFLTLLFIITVEPSFGCKMVLTLDVVI